MAGTLVIDTLKSSTANPPTVQNTSGTEVGQFCRAWVNFNGSTAGIRASFNVSSITRNGTGDYTVNFTNAMTDTNYAASINASIQWGGGWALGVGYTQAAAISSNETPTTTKFRFSTPYVSGATQSVYDPVYVNASVFR